MSRNGWTRWTPAPRVLDEDAARKGEARVRREPVYQRLNLLIDEALRAGSGPAGAVPAPSAQAPADSESRRHTPFPREWSRRAS